MKKVCGVFVRVTGKNVRMRRAAKNEKDMQEKRKWSASSEGVRKWWMEKENEVVLPANK